MEARMKNPAAVLPGFFEGIMAAHGAVAKGGLPESVLHLTHLRASQINGCGLCVDMHAYELRQMGETDERLFAVAAWRDAPYFTDAERAALALTEAVTRLSDREDPVPDTVWDGAKQHYDESALAALLLAIAKINVWNRLNVATRQPANSWRALVSRRAAAVAS